MKAILFTTLLTTPLVQADISLGNGTPVVPAADAAAPVSQNAQAYIDINREIIALFKALADALSGVTDQASADAAAPKIQELTTRMEALQSRTDTLPPPNAATEQQVKAEVNVQEVQQLVSAFLQSFIRIGMNNGYNSQPLLDALAPVMNALPGQME